MFLSFWNKIRSKTLSQGLVADVASRCTFVACRQRRFGRFGSEKMDLANLEISAKKKRSRTRSRRSRIWRCKRSLRTSHWRWSTGVVGIFTGLETKKTIENWRMKAQHIFSFFFLAFQEGFLRGVATIRQLFGVALAEGWPRVPAQLIRDQPRFGHRGLMLDVSRHFFELSFLKRLLDPRILVWSFAELWKMCF